MRPVNEKLASDILEAGKREFLEKGFAGVNMRSLASSLGVTTGAIYRYYSDKEELFSALVDGPAMELVERYRRVQKEFAAQELQAQVAGLPEVSEDGQAWMMSFIYDNFDAFKLITCCAAGTRYEHYTDILAEIETESGIRMVSQMREAGYVVQPMDDELIHMVSTMLFNGIFETVRHDMPREKAMAHMTTLKDFYSAGWFKILGIKEA
ncbi:MAG: TetR/AcrR family transcriptional regulator [Eubacteriales bacterium]|nr:TetR/AcrR family transcriptional regulator [Eubacteriales bacterium]